MVLECGRIDVFCYENELVAAFNENIRHNRLFSGIRKIDIEYIFLPPHMSIQYIMLKHGSYYAANRTRRTRTHPVGRVPMGRVLDLVGYPWVGR